MTAVIERKQLTERDLDQAKACSELVQKGSVLAAILNGIIDDDVLVIRKDKELSPAQVAEILGVSRPYVTRLLKSGLLESHMVGSHHRITVPALQAYMANRDAGRKEYARAINSRAKDIADAVDEAAPVSKASQNRMRDLVMAHHRETNKAGTTASSGERDLM